jgi:hypothetical protein
MVCAPASASGCMDIARTCYGGSERGARIAEFRIDAHRNRCRALFAKALRKLVVGEIPELELQRADLAPP